MSERLKIADQKINPDGTITFHVFGPAGEDGKQHVAGNFIYNLSSFKPDLLAYLAARGFGTIAAGQYTKAGSDVKQVVDAVFADMSAGTWTPGRHFGSAEPSAFVEALAQLTNTPIPLVLEDMENKTKWTKSYTAVVRRDPRVAAAVAKIEKARAETAERAAREAAKGKTSSLDLGGLFGTVESQSEEEAA